MQFSLSIMKKMTNEMKFCFKETGDIKAHINFMIKIDKKLYNCKTNHFKEMY